jgi:hypothetical protein
MNEREYIDKRVELSHLALAKTVSDFGAVVANNNNEIIDLKRLVKDFIVRADKMLDDHEQRIGKLKDSDTEIRSSFRSGKFVASIAAVVVIGLIGTITTLGYNIYLRDLLAINVKIDKIQAQTK